MEEAIYRKWRGLWGSSGLQVKGCGACGVSTEIQKQERVTDVFT